MVDGLPKHAEISEAVGDDIKGYRKDRSNGAGPGRNLKVVGTVDVTLWKQEVGGDRGDAQGPDRIPPSGGALDHGDDGKTWGRRRVVVSRGRGGNGLRGD